MEKMEQVLKKPYPEDYPRCMTKLSPHLYIGNYHDAASFAYLRRIGITHVLNCAAYSKRSSSPYPPDSGVVKYLELCAVDSTTYDMKQHIQKAKTFIDDAKQKGMKVCACKFGWPM